MMVMVQSKCECEEILKEIYYVDFFLLNSLFGELILFEVW